jgi:pilus assembly protein TadC
MTNLKLALAVGLATATLAFVLTNVLGGPAYLGDVDDISAIASAVAAFVISQKQRSYLVAGLLAASGIIFMVPALIATGYLAVIVLPGPILGVISGLGILGLGVAKGIRTARVPVATASLNR